LDFLVGILSSIIGNFLTDLTKSVMNWNNLFGSSKIQPSEIDVPHNIQEQDRHKYARRMINHARFESFKCTFIMVTWSAMMLFSSAMLTILLSTKFHMQIALQSTRLSWLPFENVSALQSAVVFACVAFFPVFLIGQISTKYIEYLYDREWADVTPQKYVVFFMRSVLPLIIVYAGLVVFCFYPQTDFVEAFKYPLYVFGGMFVLAIAGYRP
jgi:hypothetical protein